jgi:adenylosuccinate lyase
MRRNGTVTVLQIRSALLLIEQDLKAAIESLAGLARKYPSYLRL